MRMGKECDALLRSAKATFEANGDWSKTCDDVLAFRKLAKRSDGARRVLVGLLSHEDVIVRLLAAEALSEIRADSRRSIPVLADVLDAYGGMGYPPEYSMYAQLALRSLANYEQEAVAAEKTVWPYLYRQDDLHLCIRAAEVLMNVADASDASRTIVSLLCSHRDVVLRELCQKRLLKHDEEGREQAAPQESRAEGYVLHVSGKELKQALKEITRFRKKKGMGELMILSFADGALRFTMDSVSVGASAKGTWPGDVLAPALSIYLLARIPPKEETVKVILDSERVKIGSSVINVQWGAGATL
jgi:hypothetical protein